MNKEVKRTFTQRELEKIIAERLVRERRTVEAFDELRRTLDALIKDGTLNADSYAEAVRELCKALPDSAENMRTSEDTPSDTPDVDTAGDVQPASDVAPDASPDGTVGTSHDALPVEDIGTSHDALPIGDIGEASDGDDFPFAAVTPDRPDSDGEALDGGLPFATVVPGAEEAERAPSERVDYPDVTAATRNAAELCELLEAHPSLDVESLLHNRAYTLYRQKYGGTLLEAYNGYVRLLDTLGSLDSLPEAPEGDSFPDASSRCSRSARRRLASTSFSGSSASPDSDAGYYLTPLQREIAKSAGISYSEYSAMLNEVPERRRREVRG